MRFFLLLVVTTICANLFAQATIIDSIWYKDDKSFRTYKVWLPADYDSTETYQTIYTLDASLLFNPTVSSVEIYSNADIGVLPPTIVIGLYFNERNDDMGINWGNGKLSDAGRAFQNLIRFELVPAIESNYLVSNYRTIIGHSNSSTFVKSFLWETDRLFDAYLSMSEFKFDSSRSQFCSLVISDERPINLTMISGKKDAPYRYESGIEHQEILDSCRPKNLHYTHLQLESADHLTMVPQGIPLGLEELYADYHRPLPSAKDVATRIGDQSPIDYVDNLVARRSKKYGLHGNYGFNDINLLFNIYIELADSVNVWRATEKYVQLFNDSSEYFYEAQVLEDMGAYKAAERSYLKHLSYYPAPGIWSYKRIVWLYLYKLKINKPALLWAENGFAATSDPDFIELIGEIAKETKSYRKKCIRTLQSILRSGISEADVKMIEKLLEELHTLDR